MEFRPEITAIQVNIGRSSQGLLISARTNPKIEEFFKNISDGAIEPVDLRVNGRQWTQKSGENILQMYSIEAVMAVQGSLAMNAPGFGGYRLDVPGRKIVDVDRNTGLQHINLSFLRTVGISEQGVSFTVKGVYSDPQIRQIHDGILAGTSQFCYAFLSPINLQINLVET